MNHAVLSVHYVNHTVVSVGSSANVNHVMCVCMNHVGNHAVVSTSSFMSVNHVLCVCVCV